MRILIPILALFIVACAKSTPKGAEDFRKEYLGAEVLDANETSLGTLEDFQKGFIFVRTSEGFVDMLRPDGMPFAEWHDQTKSPKDQNWMFYLAEKQSEGRYMIVPKDTTLPDRATFVWSTSDTNQHWTTTRACIAAGAQPRTLLGDGSYRVLFDQGIGDKGYHYHIINNLTDSKDSYLTYADGMLTSDVKAYNISTSGCKTNEDIGYPATSETGDFAVKGPVKLKKEDGTIVDVADVL